MMIFIRFNCNRYAYIFCLLFAKNLRRERLQLHVNPLVFSGTSFTYFASLTVSDRRPITLHCFENLVIIWLHITSRNHYVSQKKLNNLKLVLLYTKIYNIIIFKIIVSFY